MLWSCAEALQCYLSCSVGLCVVFCGSGWQLQCSRFPHNEFVLLKMINILGFIYLKKQSFSRIFSPSRMRSSHLIELTHSFLCSCHKHIKLCNSEKCFHDQPLVHDWSSKLEAVAAIACFYCAVTLVPREHHAQGKCNRNLWRPTFRPNWDGAVTWHREIGHRGDVIKVGGTLLEGCFLAI